MTSSKQSLCDLPACKAIILAGGYGTRLMEETEARPKPMIEIGGRPILWHIMKIYSAYGITEFVIPLGYKGHMIKQYFADYHLQAADVTFDFTDNSTAAIRRNAEPWKVTLVDTGLQTMTGGRIKRLREFVGDGPFCLTYGDGVAALDLRQLIKFHLSHGRIATLTAVRPASRFGVLETEDGLVKRFDEKPLDGERWVNGGFFVLSPKIFDYIEDDQTVFEQEPLKNLAHAGELMAFHHEGFWYSMDTLRDKRHLETLWTSGRPPWKVW